HSGAKTAEETTFTTSPRQNYRFDHLRPPKPPPSPPQTTAEMVNVTAKTTTFTTSDCQNYRFDHLRPPKPPPKPTQTTAEMVNVVILVVLKYYRMGLDHEP
ncbi:hypothetical protein KUCAC02_032205, partial [Chaenocephalus aceratus]